MSNTIITIIPARGGSKGIPGKNIRLLSEKPLIAHSILDAQESQLVDQVYVTTDDSEIATVSRKYGAEIIQRPLEFATDTASSESALLHALIEIEKAGINPELIIFLQCTSPLRSGYDIDRAIKQIREENADSLLSVSPTHRFLWHQVEFIPLLDKNRHLVAIALSKSDDIRIGDFIINSESPAFIIAEIGNNHNGSLELAKQLIDQAIAAGADCAKFQMRDLKSLYRNAGNSNDNSEDLGSQYTLDLLSRFQLSPEELFKAFDYCYSQGILPLCTPWDLESLTLLENYGMKAYKVASADLTNHELLTALAKTGKPLLCSTGMATEQEISESVKLLKELGAMYVLLHCNFTSHKLETRGMNQEGIRGILFVNQSWLNAIPDYVLDLLRFSPGVVMVLPEGFNLKGKKSMSSAERAGHRCLQK